MKAKLLGSIFLLGFSGVMMVKFFNTEVPQWDAAIVGLILAAVVPAIGGFSFLFSYITQRQAENYRRERIQEQNLNADIIRLADRKGGKLTIFEVMAEFNLNAETAEHALNGLIMRRLAQRKMNDAGAYVYLVNNVRRLQPRRSPSTFLQRRLA